MLRPVQPTNNKYAYTQNFGSITKELAKEAVDIIGDDTHLLNRLLTATKRASCTNSFHLDITDGERPNAFTTAFIDGASKLVKEFSQKGVTAEPARITTHIESQVRGAELEDEYKFVHDYNRSNISKEGAKKLRDEISKYPGAIGPELLERLLKYNGDNVYMLKAILNAVKVADQNKRFFVDMVQTPEKYLPLKTLIKEHGTNRGLTDIKPVEEPYRSHETSNLRAQIQVAEKLSNSEFAKEHPRDNKKLAAKLKEEILKYTV